MMRDHKDRAQTLLNNLVEYTKLPTELVIQRCKYSAWELAYEWHTKQTNTLEYYRKTDLYIFDLTKYQSQMVQSVNYMVDYAEKYKFKKMLDLGGGIGEYSLRMVEECKAQVTYLDLKGSKTAEYAMWRFSKYQVTPKIVDETYAWWEEDWDAVIAMDVLEHMEEELAQQTIKRFNNSVKYLYINPEQLLYNEAFPQHITNFSMDDLYNFVQVDLNLYENKKLCHTHSQSA